MYYKEVKMQINFFTVNCKIFIKNNLKIQNNRVIIELIIMRDQFFICSFFLKQGVKNQNQMPSK